ncbi:MAG: hypothetical protein AB7Y46_06135 [Armatimonadota bacterium]
MNRVLGVIACAAIVLGLLVIFLHDVTPPTVLGEVARPFRVVMWNDRAIDLLGQMLVILAGAFGVLVLTKERIER